MRKKPYYLIIGLGQTGLSFIRYAQKQALSFGVWDTRAHPPEIKTLPSNVSVICGEMNPDILKKVTHVFLSPGVDPRIPEIAGLVARGVPVFSDLELFAAKVKTPYVAITGSNGKTTVTTLITESIRAAGLEALAIGNIGEPVLDHLSDRDQDWLVIEVSSFQLEATSHFKPRAAVVLNVNDNHMDRYEHLEEYGATKRRIYQGAKKAVYHRKDPLTFPLRKDRALSFGLDAPTNDRAFGVIMEDGKAYLAQGKNKLIAVEELPLKGACHLENALAVLAMSAAIGLPLHAPLSVLKKFQGLPHRCQFVCEHDGVVWYNDSKGTNVSASIAAIETVSDHITGKIILLAGGVGKNADFTLLTPAVMRHVRAMIVLGEAARQLDRIFKNFLPVYRVKTLAEAVEKASMEARRGDAVLLSPACASTDMFKNYEDRGEQFVTLCQAL